MRCLCTISPVVPRRVVIKKQLPLCRWHHQHAAPAEVRAKYPRLVPVHADGVVGGKKRIHPAEQVRDGVTG